MSSKTPTEIAAALKAAADHKAYVAKCRKEFEATPNIYAIEYIHRVSGWTYPARNGSTKPYSMLVRKHDKMPQDYGFVPYGRASHGVMVAIKDGERLRFGLSICSTADKWNKYIGLTLALDRAANGGNPWKGSVFLDEFIARQRNRLVASRNRKLYGNEAGEVSITARGDTRIEVKR